MNIETAIKVKELVIEQLNLQKSLEYLSKIQLNKKVTGLYMSIKEEIINPQQYFKEIPLCSYAMDIMLNSSVDTIKKRIEEIDNQIKQIQC